jgi:hypothetical protein
MGRRLWWAAPVVILGLVVTANTAGATAPKHKGKRPAHHATSISVSAAGRQYLALVGPVNTVQDGFVDKAHSWGNSTTDAQAEADATPLITAFQKLDTGLVDDSWPPSARSDVKSLTSADGSVIGDLQSLAGIDILSASSWLQTFTRDEQAVGVAVSEVRHDLNLPPATS